MDPDKRSSGDHFRTIRLLRRRTVPQHRIFSILRKYRHLYEIDFLISVGDKLCPIEVKSGNYRTHRSLDVFCDKFSRRIKDKYVVHIKDFKRENGINYIPVYMLPFL